MSGFMMQIPLTVDRDSNIPIQDQLESGIRELIYKGTIQSDIRLPATRILSQQLKVSRNTVKIAYLNLASQGYLVTRGTAGTFVCSKLPESTITALVDTGPTPVVDNTSNEEEASQPYIPPSYLSDKQYDFGLSYMDQTIAPERTWRRLLLKHLPYRTRYAKHMEPAGLSMLREAITHHVSPLRGISVAPEHTVIVCDDFRAYEIINHTLLKPGVCVAVEDPCDAAIRYLAKSHGAKIIPVPVDKNGIVVDNLPEENVALVYVSPSHQKPMGTTMSLKRRQQLLDWAARTGAYIAESDTFGEFRYDGSPLPSLHSLDENNRVIYINTFSTWIGSGIKLGYMAIPPRLISRVTQIKPFLNPEPSWLDQRVTTEFISSESFFGHLRRVQQTFTRRRDTLTASIEEHFGKQRLNGGKAGHHLVWYLPAHFPTAKEMQRYAAEANTTVNTLTDTCKRTISITRQINPDRILLLGYSALSEENIQNGIDQLANAVLPKIIER